MCPLGPKNFQDLLWYVEMYAAHSLGDPDDAEARRIAAVAGVRKDLFNAVAGDGVRVCLRHGAADGIVTTDEEHTIIDLTEKLGVSEELARAIVTTTLVRNRGTNR